MPRRMIGGGSGDADFPPHSPLPRAPCPPPGGGGGGARAAGGGGAPRERAHDHFEHTLGISQDVIVPEPQHTKPFAPEIAVAHVVIPIVRVLTTVDLDDELSPKARKVDHGGSNRHLPLEFLPIETMSAQPVP